MGNQNSGNRGNKEEHERAGHLGGEATKEEKGSKFYSEIGEKGGES